MTVIKPKLTPLPKSPELSPHKTFPGPGSKSAQLYHISCTRTFQNHFQARGPRTSNGHIGIIFAKGKNSFLTKKSLPFLRIKFYYLLREKKKQQRKKEKK
jgi:hypothetical protein